MSQRFESFEEFWPYYVRAHSEKTNRVLHFVGTTASVGTALMGLMTGRLALLAVAPVLGYGPAWIGHFVFEGNVPATFGHPLWSLRADFIMWSKMLRGEMEAEVEAAVRAHQEGNGAGRHVDHGVMPPINVSYEPSGRVN